MKFRVTKKGWLAIILLVAAYLFSRLYHLTILPIFCDEAIYIRWAQIMKSVPSLWSVPLSDGKQPLFMWLAVPLLGLFSNPLIAGRLVSVIAGLSTMIGSGILSWLIFRKKKLALYTMILYIFVPFGLFFDRMALVDSLLCFFITWGLVFAIWLGQTGSLYPAVLLGISLGGGWLTKSPAMIFVMLLPAAALLVRAVDCWQEFKQTRKLAVKNYLFFLLLLLGAVFLSFSIYNLLRFAPEFHMIALRNKDYVWPLAELLNHPLDPMWPHLKDAFRYYLRYFTWPLLALGLLGIISFFSAKKRRILGAVLLGVWLGPLLIEAAVAKVFTARYILFGVPAFLLFVTEGFGVFLEAFKNQFQDSWRGSQRAREIILLIVVLTPSLYFDWQLWRDPARAPLPRDEYAGYLEDWTAGWGIKEIADYVKKLPRDKNIVIGTEGFFGTLPNGLQIYLEGEKRVVVIGSTYPLKIIPKSLINARKAGDRVYLVVNQSRMEIAEKDRLKLIKAYKKPGGDRLLFFEIL